MHKFKPISTSLRCVFKQQLLQSENLLLAYAISAIISFAGSEIFYFNEIVFLHLLYDVASGNEITPCNTIRFTDFRETL